MYLVTKRRSSVTLYLKNIQGVKKWTDRRSEAEQIGSQAVADYLAHTLGGEVELVKDERWGLL